MREIFGYMNMSSKAQFRMNKILFKLFTAAFLLTSLGASASVWEGGDAENGEALFNANCASCHYTTAEVLAAPGLLGVKERWKGVSDETLILWIQNPQAAAETGDKYVKSLVERYVPTYGWMTAQAVSAEEIKDIMTYVQVAATQVADAGPVAAGDDCPTIGDDLGESESSSSTIWFLILLVLFIVVALAASGVRNSISNALNNDGDAEAGLTYTERVKAWMSRNMAFVSIIGLVLVAYGATIGYQALMGVGVYEGYQPEQPIKFSHSIHVCENEVDCQYCHSSASKSKHSGIPSTNVCMNCHKGIKKGKQYGTEEIGKIYAAIGFDPATGTYLDGEGNNGYKTPQDDFDGEPIKWNKVHNLPDHVYFNHSQHVVVGGLECQNCHGDVEKYTVGRIAPVDEVAALVNDYPGLIPLSKPTLTMGWCIECHNKAEIDLASSDYYEEIHNRLKNNDRGNEELRKYMEDEEITVRELGGWECAKCHY
jgi:mono/diheme cytochrome c family protein